MDRSPPITPTSPNLASRPGNGELVAVGQSPAVAGADGAVGVAVSGRRECYRHVTVPVRLHRGPPAEVAALGQTLGLYDRASGYREREVPKAPVTDTKLLAEPQLLGE